MNNFVSDNIKSELKKCNIQETILENVSAAITFVKNRKQLWANRRTAEIFRYTPDELQNIETRVFYKSDKDYEEIGSDGYRALACGSVYKKVLEMIRKDGTPIWVKISGKAVNHENSDDGSIWIIEDITEQREAENILIEMTERLKNAHKMAHLGDWTLDLKTGELSWSDEIFNIFEIDPTKFGASYQAFLNAIHPDDREKVDKAYLNSLSEQSNYSITHRLLMPDGRIKYVREACETDFDTNGKPLVSRGTVHDITELEEARIAAESANRIKGEFIANLSHEIRTPMNGIIAMAHLLKKSPLNSTQKEQLQIIIDSSNDLLKQLNDILDFSKIEAENITLTLRACQISKIVQESYNLMRSLAAEKNLEISVDYEDGIPEIIFCDDLRIKQILRNIIGNAIKFTDAGSVSIKVSAKNLESQQYIDIAVHDTGIGIAIDAMEAIFEPFVQANGTISRKFGGTGLGLSISRKLARLMGGDVTVENIADGGCSFHLLLPTERS